MKRTYHVPIQYFDLNIIIYLLLYFNKANIFEREIIKITIIVDKMWYKKCTLFVLLVF